MAGVGVPVMLERHTVLTHPGPRPSIALPVWHLCCCASMCHPVGLQPAARAHLEATVLLVFALSCRDVAGLDDGLWALGPHTALTSISLQGAIRTLCACMVCCAAPCDMSCTSNQQQPMWAFLSPALNAASPNNPPPLPPAQPNPPPPPMHTPSAPTHRLQHPGRPRPGGAGRAARPGQRERRRLRRHQRRGVRRLGPTGAQPGDAPAAAQRGVGGRRPGSAGGGDRGPTGQAAGAQLEALQGGDRRGAAVRCCRPRQAHLPQPPGVGGVGGG